MIKIERADRERISLRIPLINPVTLVPDSRYRELLIPIQYRNRTLADDHELDELVRGVLEKKGYNKEQIDQMMKTAEANAEYRRMVNIARKELRRRIAGQLPRLRKNSNDEWVSGVGHPLVKSYRGRRKCQ